MTAALCDGDHASPACGSAECWQRRGVVAVVTIDGEELDALLRRAHARGREEALRLVNDEVRSQAFDLASNHRETDGGAYRRAFNDGAAHVAGVLSLRVLGWLP